MKLTDILHGSAYSLELFVNSSDNAIERLEERIKPDAKRESLKITVKRTTKGNIRSKYIDRVIDLGTLIVTSDANKLFSGLFEIIYAIRCKLVHGTLEPNEYNHTVVKYAYLVLWDLMQF